LRKKRIDLCQIYYEIKDTDGWVVLPEWIEYFDTADLVPPAKWEDPEDEIGYDIWWEWYEERWIIIEDLLIVTG
jgi:hypothetical protein